MECSHGRNFLLVQQQCTVRHVCAGTSVYGLHTNGGVSSDNELFIPLTKIHISHWYQFFFFCVTVGAPFLPALTTSGAHRYGCHAVHLYPLQNLYLYDLVGQLPTGVRK